MPTHLYDVMHALVEEFGQEIVGETRLRGLISDMLPGDSVSNRIIQCAVNSRLGSQLLELQGLDDDMYNIQLANIKQAFQERNFLRHGVADYVIDCFLYSLEWSDVQPEEIPEGNESGGPRGELSFEEEENGKYYCGNRSKEGERSGFGIERSELNDYYAGEWKLDLRQGIGISVDADMNKYAGQWSINRQKGVGVSVNADGYCYAGGWKNGKRDGAGILFLPDGKQVCGLFKNGVFQTGKGICYLKDGSYIIGTMTPEGPDGPCQHFFSAGSVEEEEWCRGQRC